MNLVAVISTERLLFFHHSQLSGRLKNLAAEVSLRDIASMEVLERRSTSLTIRFADGSAVLLPIPMGGAKLAKFAAAYEER